MALFRGVFFASQDGTLHIEAHRIRWFEVLPSKEFPSEDDLAPEDFIDPIDGDLTSPAERQPHDVMANISRFESKRVATYPCKKTASLVAREVTMFLMNGDVSEWEWPDKNGDYKKLKASGNGNGRNSRR